MREVAGGVNVVGGGTPIASSVISPGYETIYAFDGSLAGNHWHSAGYGAGANWVGYDFGPGNAKKIIEIVYSQRPADAQWSPNVWFWEYSDDGVAWFVAQNGSGTYPAGSTTVIDVRELEDWEKKNRLIPDFLRRTSPSLGSPSQPVFDPDSKFRPRPGLRFVDHRGHGGMFRLAGSTTSLGNPVSRRVRLYHQRDGKLYAEQYTGPDGEFEFTHLEEGPWVVVGVDDSGAQNGVIFTHVPAVPM